MSNEPNQEGHEEERTVIEDTPENRAWIGETEPQPVKDRDSK